jgi:chromosome segregation ATPase
MRFRIGMVLLALALGAVSCGPSQQQQALSKSVTDLQAQAAQYKGELESAQTQITNMSAELTTAQTALEQASSHQATLQTERDAGQAKLTTLQTQLATLEPKLNQTQIERDQLRTDLISSAEEIVALKQAVTEVTETISPNQLASLQTKLEQTQRERDNLRTELISSAEEIVALKQPSEEASNQLSLLQQEVDRLTNELDEAHTVNANLDEGSLAATQALQGQVTELQNQLAVLKPKLEQTARERDDLRTEVIASAEEIVALKQQLDPETMSSEPVTPNSANQEPATPDVTLTASELEILQTKLAQTARERDDLRTELIKSAEEIVSLQQTPQIALETMTSERDTLFSNLSELQGSLRTLQSERDGLNAQVSTLTAQMRVMGQTLENVQQERDTLQTQLAETKSQGAEVQGQTVQGQTVQGQTVQGQTVQGQGEMTQGNDTQETLASAQTPEIVATGTPAEIETAQAKALELTRSYQTLFADTKTLTTLSEAQQRQLDKARQTLMTAQQEVARLTGARGIHTVQRGDTLSSVAASFYNKASNWPKVLESNRFILGDNADDIIEGMVLIIPQ